MPPQISRVVQALEPSATLAMAAKAKELKAAGKKVYDFSVGEPDFTTPATHLPGRHRGHAGRPHALHPGQRHSRAAGGHCQAVSGRATD